VPRAVPVKVCRNQGVNHIINSTLAISLLLASLVTGRRTALYMFVSYGHE